MSTLSKLGEEVMFFSDWLAQEFGSDIELNDCIIIADITVQREDGGYNPIQYRASDPRRYVQVALIEEAKVRAEEMRDEAVEIPEDD